MADLVCAACGTPIPISGAYPTEDTLYEAIGYIPYCKQCMKKQFKRYTESIRLSKTNALYMMCVKFSVAIYPSIIKQVLYSSSSWFDYLEQLKMRDRHKKVTAFGVTSSISAFWKDRAQEDDDQEDEDAQQMEEWQKEWGSGFSIDDYLRLDQLYAGYADSRSTLDGEAEIKLHTVCKWTLDRDKLAMDSKNKYSIQAAKSLQGMIDNELSGASLRKKDELPNEGARVDDFIMALERAGYVENGEILPYDQLIEKIKSDNPRYPYTKDAADQMILLEINATRFNEGMGELSGLPDSMRIYDVHHEFRDHEDDREKTVKKKLELVNMPLDGESP